MRVVSLIACVVSVGVLAVHVDLPEPFKDVCIVEQGINKYDPLNQYNVPWFNIDLDAPPEQRWVQVATHYKQEIKGLIGVIIDLIVPIFPGALDFIDDMFADVVDKFPTPYREEIQSISAASEVPIGQIVLYNIFYEIFTVCTSIVAQDPQEHVYHARNLDFGLFLGWNHTSHEWQVSSHLRKMVINVNWIKNGKILFKSNNYAGYIGIYNGLKPQAFSITANERFGLQGGYVGMIRWLLDMEPNGKWMSWLTRETLEEKNSYEEALDHLSNTPMLSPVYYILGGMKPWQGSIITRSLNNTDLLNQLDSNNMETGWYLLQTNYDPNQEPLYLDDRRTPGNHCIKKLTQQQVGFEGIYNVLSSTTSLNKLTTYTVLMSVESGRFETHLQACPGSCWPF